MFIGSHWGIYFMSETHIAELKQQAIRRLVGRSAGAGAGGEATVGAPSARVAATIGGCRMNFPAVSFHFFPARRLVAGQPKGCFESKAQNYQMVCIIFSGRCVTCDHSKFSR